MAGSGVMTARHERATLHVRGWSSCKASQQFAVPVVMLLGGSLLPAPDLSRFGFVSSDMSILRHERLAHSQEAMCPRNTSCKLIGFSKLSTCSIWARALASPVS